MEVPWGDGKRPTAHCRFGGRIVGMDGDVGLFGTIGSVWSAAAGNPVAILDAAPFTFHTPYMARTDGAKLDSTCGSAGQPPSAGVSKNKIAGRDCSS